MRAVLHSSEFTEHGAVARISTVQIIHGLLDLVGDVWWQSRQISNITQPVDRAICLVENALGTIGGRPNAVERACQLSRYGIDSGMCGSSAVGKRGGALHICGGGFVGETGQLALDLIGDRLHLAQGRLGVVDGALDAHQCFAGLGDRRAGVVQVCLHTAEVLAGISDGIGGAGESIRGTIGGITDAEIQIVPRIAQLRGHGLCYLLIKRRADLRIDGGSALIRDLRRDGIEFFVDRVFQRGFGIGALK